MRPSSTNELGIMQNETEYAFVVGRFRTIALSGFPLESIDPSDGSKTREKTATPPVSTDSKT